MTTGLCSEATLTLSIVTDSCTAGQPGALRILMNGNPKEN